MGPLGWDKLPYKSVAPLPETTAISSSSWPGDKLELPEQSRVDEEAPTFPWESFRPRNDSTSRFAVDITVLTGMEEDGWL